MQSKARNFHTFSVLSPCDSSLQATGVWHCDGMTQPFTLLKVHCSSTSAKMPYQTTATTTKEIKKEHKCSGTLQPVTARFHIGEMVTRPELIFCVRDFPSSSVHSKYSENAEKHTKA